MFSCNNGNNCNALRGLLVDKQADTVKVNVGTLAVDKENQAPDPKPQLQEEEQKRVRFVQEQERQADEEKKRLEEEAEETKRLEREAEDSRLRQEHEEQLRLAQIEKHRNEERRRIEEEQRVQQMEQDRRLAEELREQQLHAETQAQLEEQRRLESAQKQEMLRSFLSGAGFTDVNEKKKEKSSMFSSGFTYPLHAAVKANDVNMVQLLLQAGADRTLSNSKKVTPLAIAQKLDKGGSHREIITVLSA